MHALFADIPMLSALTNTFDAELDGTDTHDDNEFFGYRYNPADGTYGYEYINAAGDVTEFGSSPRVWRNLDLEGSVVTQTETFMDKANDVYESEVTVNDLPDRVYDDGSFAIVKEEPAVTEQPKFDAAFPVLTGMYFGYAPNGDVSQTCFKCQHTMYWGGFAGDGRDFAIAGMQHWYGHKRDARNGKGSPDRVKGEALASLPDGSVSMVRVRSL